MFEESDHKKFEIIKTNTYRAFESLLKNSNSVPKEFTQETSQLSSSQHEQMLSAGADGVEDQLKEFIDQLRDFYDPETYGKKIVGIINAYQGIIDEDLSEDLINYVRYGKKRRQS